MTKSSQTIPLTGSLSGQWIRIISIPEGVLRAQFIRVGIHEGERVQCMERLPGGTIVIRRNRQQIAIGHQLAGKIFVIVLMDEE